MVINLCKLIYHAKQHKTFYTTLITTFRSYLRFCGTHQYVQKNIWKQVSFLTDFLPIHIIDIFFIHVSCVNLMNSNESATLIIIVSSCTKDKECLEESIFKALDLPTGANLANALRLFSGSYSLLWRSGSRPRWLGRAGSSRCCGWILLPFRFFLIWIRITISSNGWSRRRRCCSCCFFDDHFGILCALLNSLSLLFKRYYLYSFRLVESRQYFVLKLYRTKKKYI